VAGADDVDNDDEGDDSYSEVEKYTMYIFTMYVNISN